MATQNQQQELNDQNTISENTSNPLAKLNIKLLISTFFIIAFIIGYLISQSMNNRTTIMNSNISPSAIPTQLIEPLSTPAHISGFEEYWKKLINICDGEGSKPQDLHFTTKNNIAITRVACRGLDGGNFARYSNKYYQKFLGVLFQDGSGESLFNIDFVDKNDKEQYATNRKSRDISNREDIVIVPLINDTYSGSAADYFCGNPAPCYIGQDISVFIEGRKYQPISNDKYIVFSVNSVSIIKPNDQRLNNLLYKYGDVTYGNNTNNYGKGNDVLNSSFNNSLLISTFEKEFNAPNWNGKTPIQLTEEFLDSISIDKDFINSLNNPVSPTNFLPDFFQETVKPKTNIDISDWKTFDDPRIGLRFKYPVEWGKPERQLDRGEAGFDYIVTFAYQENSTFFGIRGVTRDFERSSGMEALPRFSGDISKVCSDYKDSFIYCENFTDRVHALESLTCTGPGTNSFAARYMFLRRQRDFIPGFVFSGEYLSKNTRQKIFNLMLPKYGSYCSEPDPQYLHQFNQAVLNRQLDSESMQNFDTIEKVFETVESY